MLNTKWGKTKGLNFLTFYYWSYFLNLFQYQNLQCYMSISHLNIKITKVEHMKYISAFFGISFFQSVDYTLKTFKIYDITFFSHKNLSTFQNAKVCKFL